MLLFQFLTVQKVEIKALEPLIIQDAICARKLVIES